MAVAELAELAEQLLELLKDKQEAPKQVEPTARRHNRQQQYSKRRWDSASCP